MKIKFGIPAFKIGYKTHLNLIYHLDTIKNIKVEVKSVLHIGSAHNKRGPSDLKIVEILYFLAFFRIETLVYIHLRAYSKPEQLDFQLVSYFTNFAVQNVNKAFVYITDLTSTLNFMPCHGYTNIK